MTRTDAARAPRPWWLLDVVAAVALPVLAVAVLGYIAAGTLVLPSVLLFSVPQIDTSSWMHQTPPAVSPNYCGRTDSENCPGG